MYDWSKAKITPKPAITGYVFHSTKIPIAVRILGEGRLRPSIGDISFTLDPCFNVGLPSIVFVFPESVIREKYGGRELPPPHYWTGTKEEWEETWEEEMEVHVVGKYVYLDDCVEVLPDRAACWKYGKGYGYHFKDLRERATGPLRTLRRILG